MLEGRDDDEEGVYDDKVLVVEEVLVELTVTAEEDEVDDVMDRVDVVEYEAGTEIPRTE